MIDVKIKVTLINSEETLNFETYGILDEKRNILIYDESNNVKVILNMKENVLKRETPEYLITLNFLQATTNIFLKDLNKEINAKLKILEIINNNRIYEVKYILNEEQKINYKVEITN
ncbi:MAG: hypothetical protein ACI4OG_00705 [Bacilli bacterium]